MASLQARSPLRSAHPLFFVNKLVSLTAFFVLLCVGWVVVSFLKSDTFDRWRSGSSASAVPASKSANATLKEVSSGDVKPLVTPARLVYACADDKYYFHASTHVPERCERTALSEEAAGQRGLTRCKSCFPE